MKKYRIFAALCLISLSATVRAQNFSFSTDLRLGASGADVVQLQTWLIQNGFDIPAVSSGAAAKGYFGHQTKVALIRYQNSVGLPAYGFFGPMTRARIGGSRGDSLKITSPNGGETWVKGTTQNITWTGAPGVLNQTGDIRLEYALPACARPGQPIRCMIMTRAPQTIATGVNLNSGLYAWLVGKVLIPGCAASTDSPSNYCGSTTLITAGQYRIQICPTNGSQCVESDNDFTITSTSTASSSTQTSI